MPFVIFGDEDDAVRAVNSDFVCLVNPIVNAPGHCELQLAGDLTIVVKGTFEEVVMKLNAPLVQMRSIPVETLNVDGGE